MAKTRKLTCIVCPRGCELSVSLSNSGEVLETSGYFCPRGKDYAVAECTAPVRTVTSTVMCEDGAIVAVKTAAPIPKGMVFDVMKAINSVLAPKSVKIGDVVIANVCGTDVDVVATSKH